MAWGWHSQKDSAPISAIAIKSFDGHNTHVGIVYRIDDETDNVRILHLAFHCRLLPEDYSIASGDYLILVPNLPSSVLEAVASRCRITAKSNPILKYGFLVQKDARIDGEGHYFVNDERGENCSSFVLMLFRSIGVTLINEGSWPSRVDDEFRYRQLWCMLLNYVRERYSNLPDVRKVHEDFVKKIAPDVTAIRIRPEETAGSCLSESFPVEFAECERHGLGILARLFPNRV